MYVVITVYENEYISISSFFADILSANNFADKYIKNGSAYTAKVCTVGVGITIESKYIIVIDEKRLCIDDIEYEYCVGETYDLTGG